MLDWIFEGIVTWVSSIASELMDAVSRVFLDALGTDMDAMEGYFPFVTKAFEVMQYMAWAVLFLITVWQLFRVFGGDGYHTSFFHPGDDWFYNRENVYRCSGGGDDVRRPDGGPGIQGPLGHG